jgi:hypothetical protein
LLLLRQCLKSDLNCCLLAKGVARIAVSLLLLQNLSRTLSSSSSEPLFLYFLWVMFGVVRCGQSLPMKVQSVRSQWKGSGCKQGDGDSIERFNF